MDDLELRHLRLAEVTAGAEKPVVFGEKGGLWARYDTIADAYDKDMLGRLHSNLDVLLIFAGLFSAVNTAFIVVTLANLSSNSLDETNTLLRLLVSPVNNNTFTADSFDSSFNVANAAIRQNCTFFASLCSSLLAATGAVIAKQWLVTYGRTGQTGSLESQSLRRTEKFLGAEAWGLQPVVEFLPTLLLISLALFFVALVDFLWTISLPVALVVLVFFAMGALSYSFTVIAAAIDPQCPFQTSVSSHLRQVWLNIVPLARKASRTIVVRLRPVRQLIYSWSLSTRRAISQTSAWAKVADQIERRTLNKPQPPPAHIRCPDESTAFRKEVLCAQSIGWMLEIANEDGDLCAIAENIPAISHHREAIRVLARSSAFPGLVAQFGSAMKAVERIDKGEFQGRIDAEHATTTALAFARAVGHVFSSDPKWYHGAVWKVVYQIWPHASGQEAGDRRETYLIHEAIQRLCGRFRINDKRTNVRRVRTALRSSTRVTFSSLNGGVLNPAAQIAPPNTLSRSTSLLVSTLLTLSGSINLFDYGIPETDTSFSHSAIAIRQEIAIQLGEVGDWDQIIDDIWTARTGLVSLAPTRQFCHMRGDADPYHDRLLLFHTSNDRRTMKAEMSKALRAHEYYITATHGKDRYLLRSHADLLGRLSRSVPFPMQEALFPVAPQILKPRAYEPNEPAPSNLQLEPPEGFVWNPIRSLAERVSRHVPDDYARNAFVAGLHNLSRLFDTFVTAAPNTALPSLMQPGQQTRGRLSSRSPEDVQDEFMKYALQLLVGYSSGALVADSDHEGWASAHSPVLAHALVTLEIGRHLELDGSELRHLIFVLGIIASNVQDIAAGLLPQHLLVHPSISPALVSALSLPEEVDAPMVAATWELLNYVGSTSGSENIRVGGPVPCAIIGAELGSVIIRSFCRLAVDVNIDEGVDGEPDTERQHISSFSHILAWLAGSLRQDPTLAAEFTKVGVGSLFSYVVRTCIRSPAEGDDGGWMDDGDTASTIAGHGRPEVTVDKEDGCGLRKSPPVSLFVGETGGWPRDIALLSVGLLHFGAIEVDHAQSSRLDALAAVATTPSGASRNVASPMMPVLECETLAMYMRGFMCHVSEADLALDLVQLLFRHTFSVLEHAFLSDPSTAFAAKLDEACDLVIKEVDGSSHKGTYAPWWDAARRAYQRALPSG